MPAIRGWLQTVATKKETSCGRSGSYRHSDSRRLFHTGDFEDIDPPRNRRCSRRCSSSRENHGDTALDSSLFSEKLTSKTEVVALLLREEIVEVTALTEEAEAPATSLLSIPMPAEDRLLSRLVRSRGEGGHRGRRREVHPLHHDASILAADEFCKSSFFSLETRDPEWDSRRRASLSSHIRSWPRRRLWSCCR